ncbi:MAG: ABC transporter substrate-binding protein [Thermaerobacter sp.]|nr:ABC transporter substrate-binding protein [Thermaerobacter sp.]
MARAWPWLLVALGLAPALLVHAAAPPSVPLHATSQQVPLAVFDNPNTVAPATATTLAGRLVADNVFQTLFRLGPHGTVRPDLAESALSAGTTVTVVLSAARLTNGRPVTAAMVAQALSRLATPAGSTPTTRRLLADIVGVGRAESGHAPAVSGIQTSGAHRVVFHLKTPSSTFVAALANPVLGIVPTTDLTQGGPYWQTSNLIGSSGYQLQQFEPNALMNFARAHGPAVTITRYPTFAEAWHAFQNGAVAALPISLAQRPTLPALARPALQYLPTGGALTLMVNQAVSGPWTTGGGVAALRRVGLARWIRRALGSRVTPSLNHLASLVPPGAAAVHAGTAIPLAVDASNPESVALGRALGTLAPKRFVVQDLGAAALRREWAAGTLAAVLAPVFSNDPWTAPAHGTVAAVSLAPTGAFWLVAPGLHGVQAFSDGALDWATAP